MDETDESYMKRKWFIGEYKPKTKKQYEEAVRLSNIWVNMLYLKCIYPAKVQIEILEFVKGAGKPKKVNVKNIKTV